jgi:cytochrome d ubiquinol oxidase subunit I
VISVSAYYLIKGRHIDFAKASLKIAVVLLAFVSIFQLFSGHQSAVGVAGNQPAKMAAFEGHYQTGPGALYLFGWVDEDKSQTYGIKIPGMLSWLIYFDSEKPVTGLNEFVPEDRPPVNVVFQSYHLMVAIGMALILISLLGLFFWWRGTLFDKKWMLWVMVISVLLPQAGNQLGWMSAEVGRQPWIVYGLLRTSDAISKAVEPGQIWFSLVLFGLIYLLLFVLFIFLLDRKIKHGPEEADTIESEYTEKPTVLDAE